MDSVAKDSPKFAKVAFYSHCEANQKSESSPHLVIQSVAKYPFGRFVKSRANRLL